VPKGTAGATPETTCNPGQCSLKGGTAKCAKSDTGCKIFKKGDKWVTVCSNEPVANCIIKFKAGQGQAELSANPDLSNCPTADNYEEPGPCEKCTGALDCKITGSGTGYTYGCLKMPDTAAESIWTGDKCYVPKGTAGATPETTCNPGQCSLKGGTAKCAKSDTGCKIFKKGDKWVTVCSNEPVANCIIKFKAGQGQEELSANPDDTLCPTADNYEEPGEPGPCEKCTGALECKITGPGPNYTYGCLELPDGATASIWTGDKCYLPKGTTGQTPEATCNLGHCSEKGPDKKCTASDKGCKIVKKGLKFVTSCSPDAVTGCVKKFEVGTTKEEFATNPDISKCPSPQDLNTTTTSPVTSPDTKGHSPPANSANAFLVIFGLLRSI